MFQNSENLPLCLRNSNNGHYSYNIHRRIDIKQYPRSEFPFALLYFTGDGEFNRGQRNMAHKYWPPLSLNDHGLFPVDKCKTAGGKEIGTSLTCNSEEDIFERMGLVYKAPHERCGVESVMPLPDQPAGTKFGLGFRWHDYPKNRDYDGFFHGQGR